MTVVNLVVISLSYVIGLHLTKLFALSSLIYLFHLPFRIPHPPGFP